MTTCTMLGLRTLLRSLYKHDRFEGRDGDVWGAYSDHVVSSQMAQLDDCGYSCVSGHDSASGAAIWFSRDLQIVPAEHVARTLGWRP